MNGKQIAILWMGLLLIAFRAFSGGQWSALWSVVSKPTASATTTTPSSTAVQQSGGVVAA